MEEKIIRSRVNGKEIILVPTAHVSTESADLVKKTIEEERPDSVCIELDEGRYENIQNPDRWKDTHVVQVIKDKKVALLLANLVLSSYQRNIAKKLGTKPGGEMLRAMASAEEVGAQLVLADRDIQTTFKRIWRSLGFFKKCQLAFSLLLANDEDEEVSEEDLEKLMERDNLEGVVQSLSEDFPEIAQTLLHERDQYLAYHIKHAPGDKVLAVLGAAHSLGVEKELSKDQDIAALDEIPKPSTLSKVLPWLIPLVILGLLAYGFYQSLATGTSQVKSWFIYNAGFAALFTLIGFGHPLSILTAFVAAPFTSLNPLIACGWLVGLVEASVRKPTVEDVNRVPEDITSFKTVHKNRFLKALYLVILANIGSSIGTLIAGTSIVKNLF